MRIQFHGTDVSFRSCVSHIYFVFYFVHKHLRKYDIKSFVLKKSYTVE